MCMTVFRVRVLSQNIADVLVAQGRMRLGSSVLMLHTSKAAAVRHARSLSPRLMTKLMPGYQTSRQASCLPLHAFTLEPLRLVRL